MAKSSIILDQINGLSDSPWSGIAGSVAECVGLDLHSTPGLTKVRQKLTRVSVSSGASTSLSMSPSASQSLSPSASRSPSASASSSPSSSTSPSSSQSQSPSASQSPSSSQSLSPSASRSPSSSISLSPSPSSAGASDIDSFIKIAVPASNGYHFWFSSTSGKIWAISPSGTITLAYITVAEAGASGCLGAIEYNGFIYWATQSRLHRIAIGNADESWFNVSLNWATFTKTDSEFHPMAIQDLTLFIGDGNLVASVDEAGVYLDNALDINTPNRIKCMTDYEFDLLLGTFVANTVNKTQIIRWDTISPSWNTSDTIEESGINAFIKDDNNLFVNAGRSGNIYFYNGEKLLQYKRIPGEYSSTSYGYVHPGSVGNFMGQPIFGFSNGSGNPAKQGVYMLGSYSKDYTKKLDLSFPISENVLEGIEIGAILVLDFDLYVAWKRGDVYGIDKIDYSAKYPNAYFETMMLFQNMRDVLKSLKSVLAFYHTLPSGCGFTFSYSVNGANYVEMDDRNDTVINAVKSELTVPTIGSLSIKVEFDVSGNDAPTMECLGVNID